ncbi:conserved hypothetical protein [Candidatus Methylobacter favarea]|uniref:DUF2333 family protein n=1 Tax=Candidatus Methylobacter favarea TaxID=2707345 RepID=A0A8S0WLG9_9GAMM|nr:DUF2333 family protein [Candidatus Methylobacter favarea]CAA9892610.1 conserved hypothetical protein [Candidatus Methylobacter favarea]
MAAIETLQDVKSKGILWVFGVFVIIILVIQFILGAWWGSEPEQFNIQDEALKRAKETHTSNIPVGYTYTNTLAHIAEVLMYKPGGYITNDVAPPGVFLDNISNWEYGALVMLRDATTALRNHFARDQSQSAEDADLAVAEPYFYYENDSWALPSTEAEYQKGIDALHKYMSRLQKYGGNVKQAQFYSRADNLWQYTEVVIKRLGGLSTRLTANSSGSNYGPGLSELEIKKAEEQGTPIAKVTWLEIDDIFYEARGASWALLHILRAIKHDFADILIDKRAMRTVDIMIKALENALTPILSPMILNGGGYGLFANYSLTMANYIARANAAALDLRDIMNRG